MMATFLKVGDCKMHFCAQELQAIIAILPFANIWFHYICMLTNKAFCKYLCKTDCCEENHGTTSKSTTCVGETVCGTK